MRLWAACQVTKNVWRELRRSMRGVRVNRICDMYVPEHFANARVETNKWWPHVGSERRGVMRGDEQLMKTTSDDQTGL